MQHTEPDRSASPYSIAELRRKIDDALSDRLAGVRRPALLEFPPHPNVGDSAIWLGQLRYLTNCRGLVPYRTADILSYSPDRLSSGAGADIILICGGGSLGDIWKGGLDVKIRALDDFPHLPVVQLPQSIHFADPARFDDYRRAVARHPNFTLLVRDQASFDLASGRLDCDVRLCPDMAFWLDLERKARPRYDTVFLLRTDQEASRDGLRAQVAPRPDALIADWLEEPRLPIIAAERALTRATARYPRRLAFMEGPLGFLRQRAAAARVERGSRLLSSGRVVITDRLHAHILCLLLNIPHVVLDNSYGKVRGFHDAWTRGWPGVRFAQSLEEAMDAAAGLESPGTGG